MKRKHPEHVNLERWLVSYADFITLLFAFFVIMYAMSVANTRKVRQVALGMRAAFSSGAGTLIDTGGTSGGTTVNQFGMKEQPGGRIMDLPAGKADTASDPDPEVQEIRDLLEESMTLELGSTDASSQLQMQYDSRGLVVRIAAKDFFEEGQVEVVQDLRPLLDKIGKVLSKSKNLLRIEGYADQEEAKNSKYPSDWELSTSRASWVAKYLIKRFDIDPSRVGVGGYAHFRPLTLKKDGLSRGKNRRVEFIILNTRFESVQ